MPSTRGTCALIAAYLDEIRAALAALGAGLRDDAYLFSNDPAHALPWKPTWVTHQIAAAADAAGVKLDIKGGRRCTASQLLAGASPSLREEHTLRVGLAAYREAAGITHPDQAASLETHPGNPELEHMRKAVFTALEVRGEADIMSGLDCSELESRVLAGASTQAAAPPDVSGTLRLIAQAEADDLLKSADAQAQHDDAGAVSARTSPRNWSPNGSGLKQATPDTSNGPPTPSPPGRPPGKRAPTPAPRTGPAARRTAGAAWRRTADDGRMVARVRSRPPSRQTRRRPPAPGRYRRWGTLATSACTRAGSRHGSGEEPAEPACACASRARRPGSAARQAASAGR